MTPQQWEDHIEHFKDHITWPATKEEIIAACEGTDTPEEMQKDFKDNLPEGTYNSPEDLKAAMVH